MNIKEIKNGASYSARIEGTLVKGHVFVHPSKTRVFLCQNTKTGNQSSNLLGYKNSWQVNIEEGEIKWRNQGVSNFKLTNLTPRKISIKDFKEIAEWYFEIKEGVVKFGCGAVTLPLETIQNFVAVKFLSFTPKQIEDYFKVMDILSKREVNLSAADWKVLTTQFS